uniref:Uncharacterized protein n=1 Tax=Glossina pallidipes TaxID=7398 RepID=A0A1A9Z8M7_GLOPL
MSVLIFVVYFLACQFSLTLADDGGAAKRLALRRPTGKVIGKATTTTTVEPLPSEDDEGDYAEGEQDNQYADEGEDGGPSSTTTTTTTETPKRIGPVIRPFRSNDEFLNALKRRQMNAKRNKCKLKFYNKIYLIIKKKLVEKPVPNKTVQDSQEAEETAPASTKSFNKPSAGGNRRKFSKTSKSEPEDDAAEETETEQREDVKPKRPVPGRLALRKRS